MKNVKLTAASNNLLLAIFKDLPNWDNCSPAYNHTDAVTRGNLTDLKKKKLVRTFKDGGNEWITLTDAGKALAESLMESPTPMKKTTKKATPLEPTGSQLLHVTLPPVKAAKKAAAKAKGSNLKASWLVARFRNALHKSRPALKEAKTLKEVATLSEMKAALSVPTSEWENLLETFFNLGGKLEA